MTFFKKLSGSIWVSYPLWVFSMICRLIIIGSIIYAATDLSLSFSTLPFCFAHLVNKFPIFLNHFFYFHCMKANLTPKNILACSSLIFRTFWFPIWNLFHFWLQKIWPLCGFPEFHFWFFLKIAQKIHEKIEFL